MITDKAIQLYQNLPQELKREAAHFIEFLASKVRKKGSSEPEKQPSLFGHAKGKIRMSPDWDEPLEDFKDYM